MNDHTPANEQGQLNAFGRALLAHPIRDENTDNAELDRVDGYEIPIDPADALGCDSCQ